MEKWSRLGDEERGGKQGIRQPRQLVPRIIGFQGLQICRDKANVDASHLPRSFRTSPRFLLRPTFRNPYTSMPSKEGPWQHFSMHFARISIWKSRRRGEGRIDRFDPPRVPIIRYHAAHKSADNVQQQPTNSPIFRRHPLLDTPWPGNIPAA